MAEFAEVVENFLANVAVFDGDGETVGVPTFLAMSREAHQSMADLFNEYDEYIIEQVAERRGVEVGDVSEWTVVYNWLVNTGMAIMVPEGYQARRPGFDMAAMLAAMMEQEDE